MANSRNLDGLRGPSKYKAKQIALEAGERAPFEFQARPRLQGDPSSLLVNNQDAATTFAENTSLGPTETAWLVVTKVMQETGSVFLVTDQGQRVYLSLKILKHDKQVTHPKEGAKMKCVILDQANGKGLKVVKVFAVLPP